MKLSYKKYTLELKHQFRIAYSSRKTTPIVLVKIEDNGFTGYGEASLPPYLPETQDSVIDFLRKIDKKKNEDLTHLPKLISEIDTIAPNNNAAKAAINIALHDLVSKINHQPCYEYLKIPKSKSQFTSFTIGIDEPKIMKQKIREAEHFKIIKVKLGTDQDDEIIKLIRKETNKPLYVDVNQGWKDVAYAIRMSQWLHQQNVLLIEQPFNKDDLESSSRLSEKSPIPIIADESILRLSDLDKIKNSFTGINIKLMKCTGMYEAGKIIKAARQNDLKIMFGCMTETLCAISAAAQFASLVDFVDLDGNLLITNDPFDGEPSEEGVLKLSEKDGLGLELKEDFDFTEL
ncbi:MAG: dipeptide epimerase [Ignavibacteriales bacterium]|nr:dipeptide epimerase [Ignavibacteriales bacterium]